MVLPKSRHIPTRSCVCCGLKLPKMQLIRISRTPDGLLQVDRAGKGTGRGVYLCGVANCWEQGIIKGGLERGLRSALSGPEKEYLRGFYQDYLQENVPEKVDALPIGEEK